MGKQNKEKNIAELKKKWLEEDVSQDLEQEMFEDQLSWFEKIFSTEKKCEKQLLYWLGWKKKKVNATFKCTKCGEMDAKVSHKSEGKNGTKRWVFRCKTKGCSSMPSIQSVTMMKGNRLPLRFWFLCLYVVGLLNGKVPWKYLNTARVDFKSDGKKQTIQSRDMANVLYKILKGCESLETRMEYCRLVRSVAVGYEACTTYLSWYKSNSWIGWRIVFQDRFYKKQIVSKLFSPEKSHGDCDSGVLMLCLLKEMVIQEYEWLLVAKMDDNCSITGVQWMYVSSIEKITNQKSSMYKKGYRYLVIQTEDYPIDNDQPFIVGSRFKRAFVRTCRKMELDTKCLGLVKKPSATWLDQIATFYKKNIK